MSVKSNPQDRSPIEEALVLYTNSHIKKDYGDKEADTVRRYRGSLKKLLEFYMERKYDSITDNVINDFRKSLKDMGNSDVTIKMDMVPIPNFIRWAKQNGYIHPTQYFKICEGKVEEIAALFSAEDWRTLYYLMEDWAEAGIIPTRDRLRRYERHLLIHYIQFMVEVSPLTTDIAESIQWGDVKYDDEHRNIVSVKICGRPLAIADEAVAIIKKWAGRTNYKDTGQYVFRMPNGDRPEYEKLMIGMFFDWKLHILEIVRDENKRSEVQYGEQWDAILRLFQIADEMRARQPE